jgi:hypothetical protein
MGVTDRTVRRDWVKARAWLYRELNGVVGDMAPVEINHGQPDGDGVNEARIAF